MGGGQHDRPGVSLASLTPGSSPTPCAAATQTRRGGEGVCAARRRLVGSGFVRERELELALYSSRVERRPQGPHTSKLYAVDVKTRELWRLGARSPVIYL